MTPVEVKTSMADDSGKTSGSAIETIFHEAVSRPNDERAEYVKKACGGDAQLQARVEALLQAHEAPEGFFPVEPGAGPKLDLGTVNQEPPGAVEKPGDTIAHYKLLQLIGEGGFGRVYVAEQKEPVKRQVALKIIKLGMDTRQVVSRFQTERQALAMMDHPSIAKILDAGATDTGRPYFVMELVRGIKITDFCDQNNLSTNERLDLFIQVCRALQHAHQKGVIHRDIKPSNILVASDDGVPVPKVIDFGIAKATQGRLTDQTVFTAFEQFIGTPAYMSPEQAELTMQDIDTRSDIYSLGVLLYELLTGKTPFDAEELLAAGLDEMRRTIRETEPARPSTRLTTIPADELTATAKHRQTEGSKLTHLLRGDLDWIVMKCLEKDRQRRYDTANGLASDIQRHLKCEPVVACPPSRLYEFQKSVRRHKFGFLAAATVLFVLAMGVFLSTSEAIRASRAEREQIRLRVQAESEKRNAQTEAVKSHQVAQFLKDMLKGVGPSRALGKDATMLREILDQTAQRVGRDLTNQPEVEIELRGILADTYRDLGLYQQQADMAQQSLQLVRAKLGEETPEAARALYQLADALLRLGKLDQAEARARQSLALRRKLFGPEHPEVAQSLKGLANVFYYQKNLTQAQALYQEALDIWRKQSGGDEGNVASALFYLANVLREQGHWAEAETKHREALALRRKILGNEHADVAQSLNSLANVLALEDKLPEAETTQREALALKRKLLGKEHPEVASSLNNLANVLFAQGKLAQAEPLYREALEMRRKFLPKEHPNVAAGLNNLASLLREEGKLVEAEALAREGLDMRRKLFREENPDVAQSVYTLASVLRGPAKLAEAESLAREALTVERGVWGKDHPDLAQALNTLANVLEQEGNLREAESLDREALAMQRRLHVDEHQDVADSLQDLARVLRLEGQLDEASGQAEGALAMRRKLLGNQHPQVRNSLHLLALVRRDQAKLGEAEALAREALALATSDPDDGSGFAARSLLGVILVQEQKYTEAEPLLISGYEGMEQRQEKNPTGGEPLMKETLQGLAQLYQATSRPEKAAEWRKKAEAFDELASGQKAKIK